jgi:lipopolysaccharide export system permease protein
VADESPVIGKTLALYFARQFAILVIAIFLFFFFLIAVISYLEFFTRSLAGDEFDGLQVLLLTIYRVPSICEDVLPFTTLFGSIAAFVLANRRLEVVIARAAGLSAWQFLLPACIVGLTIGIIATTVYNPASTVLRAWSDQIEAKLLDRGAGRANRGGPVWIRQAAEGRESIIGAVKTSERGTNLSQVTAFVFDETGKFQERIDAPTARYTRGAWQIVDATVTRPDRQPKKQESYRLPTTLSPGQVRQTFDNLEATSFWELPELIETAQRAGLPSSRYELRYNTLLSRPIVLLAMVLIAAIVSLRFSRSRELGNMILAGVGVGFMLYVVSKIAWDLGSGGIVPPPLAAWLPAIVTVLMGATVLLHLEDG